MQSDKEINEKFLENAITESKTTDKPIDLESNKELKEMTISVGARTKLKSNNDVSAMKIDVSEIQKRIKEVDNEIQALKGNSKVIKLHEKNNLLLETKTNLSELRKLVESLKSAENEVKEKLENELHK